MKKNSEDTREPKGHYMALGMSFGLIFGAGIGVSFGMLATGGGIGMCLGMAAGALLELREKKKSEASPSKPDADDA